MTPQQAEADYADKLAQRDAMHAALTVAERDWQDANARLGDLDATAQEIDIECETETDWKATLFMLAVADRLRKAEAALATARFRLESARGTSSA